MLNSSSRSMIRQTPTRLPYSKNDSFARSRTSCGTGDGTSLFDSVRGVTVKSGILGAFLIVYDDGYRDARVSGPFDFRRVAAVTDQVSFRCHTRYPPTLANVAPAAASTSATNIDSLTMPTLMKIPVAGSSGPADSAAAGVADGSGTASAKNANPARSQILFLSRPLRFPMLCAVQHCGQMSALLVWHCRALRPLDHSSCCEFDSALSDGRPQTECALSSPLTSTFQL